MFLLVNCMFAGIISQQNRMIKIENLHQAKEKSRLLAESGIEISLAELSLGKGPETISFEENSGRVEISIGVLSVNSYKVFSQGIYGQARTRIEAVVQANDNHTYVIIEGNVW